MKSDLFAKIDKRRDRHQCFWSLSLEVTDRRLISVDRNVIHLVDVVVKEALLRMGLDDLAQGLSAELFGRQSGRLTV